MIAVARRQKRKILSSIDGTEQTGVHDVKRIGRFGIGVNLTEIPCALPEPAIIIHACPRLASVIGTINATFFRLDDGINAIRVSAGNGHADPSKYSFRQPISFEPRPRHTVIKRSIQTAARGAAGKKPHLPAAW